MCSESVSTRHFDESWNKTNNGTSVGWSHACPLSCSTHNGKEDGSMSLCVSFCTVNGTVYIASDSQSSYVLGKNAFSKALQCIPVSRMYEKICVLPISGSPVVVFSTGDNSFCDDDKTLKEFILNLDYAASNNSKDDFREICGIIDNALIAKNESAKNLVLGCYTSLPNKTVLKHSITLNNKEVVDGGKYKNENFEPIIQTSMSGDIHVIGDDWARNVVEYYPFTDTKKLTDNEAVCLINEIFKKVVEVGRYFNNSVGGLIRILKLTPDSAEWLQNKPK